MLVGVPQEIRNHEYRVGLTPGSVRELLRRGQRLIVRRGAGTANGPCAGDRSAAEFILVPGAKTPWPNLWGSPGPTPGKPRAVASGTTRP